MREQEIIDLLRHYRHDWMNDVQLLMGYASMGKIEKVEDKLREATVHADKERQLSNLDIPKTAIWIISFNWRYDNFRMEYQVDLDNHHISNHDEQLHNRLDNMMKILVAYADEMVLYRGNINFTQVNEQVQIEVNVNGSFDQGDELVNQLSQLDGSPNVMRSLTSDEITQYTITWVVS